MTDWVLRVTSLNQWRRGGERAPHKPLLLLYSLGRLQRTGSSVMAFADVERDLDALLEEFGPPRRTNPGYPFHHLVSDGLWIVRTPSGIGSPGPNRAELRARALGELEPEFARAVELSPQLFASVVHALLDSNFESTLHQDILDRVGISLAPVETGETTPLVHGARRRDPRFRDLVLVAYEYRCAACGYDGGLGHEAVGIEAAHVRWWAANGPDELANGVALCSLHHKLFDRGAIGLTTDHKVTVSSRFIGRSSAAEQLVLALVGKPLVRPQSGHAPPAAQHVSWHETQVFRGPARRASALEFA